MSIKILYDTTILSEIDYSIWLEMRENIIESTFQYLLHTFEKDKEKYGNITETTDPNYIGKTSSYYNDMMDLKYIIQVVREDVNKTENTENIILHSFVKMCNIMNSVNALLRFEVGGLYTLCTKSDHGGYYSPGNSLDICLLLDKIKPFAIKHNSYKEQKGYTTIYGIDSIYSVFNFSHATLQNIYIY